MARARTAYGIAAAALTVAVVVYIFLLFKDGSNIGLGVPTMSADAQTTPNVPSANSGDATSLNLSDSQLAAVKVRPARFHGEWNYTIRPATRPHRKL